MNNKTILQEAFKQFELLEEETFHLDNSEESVEDAKEFMDTNDALDMLDVIDPEAETEEEVEDSYTDKVILDCNVCHSKIYKDPSEIIISDDKECVNKDEECPFCYSMDGYKIIGQVKPFVEDDFDITVEPKEEETSEEGDAEVEEDTTVVEESLSKKRRNRQLKEGWSGRYSPRFLSDELGIDKDEAKRFSDYLFKNSYDAGFTTMREAADSGLLEDWYEEFKQGGKSIYIPARDYEEAVKYLESKGISCDPTEPYGEYACDLLADSVFYNVWDQPRYSHEDLKSIIKKVKQAKASHMYDDDMNESLENIDVETEHDKIHIEAEEKVESDEEMIAPLEPEVEDEIKDNQEEEEIEEEPTEDEEEIDYDIDDFDEETFDDLGESYLRKVYENVNSFRTSKVTEKGNKWIVEGRITFNSGNTKPTKFIFEALSANKKGKLNFIGENAQISRGKKSFKLSGVLDNKKFISESLNYNYRQKDATGKSVRVYGTVKC